MDLVLLKKLRAEKNKTPIIFLTARDTIRDKIKGLDFGGDDYVMKPFSFDELLARIRSLIRQSTNSDTILQPDTVEVIQMTHIVK